MAPAKAAVAPLAAAKAAAPKAAAPTSAKARKAAAPTPAAPTGQVRLDTMFGMSPTLKITKGGRTQTIVDVNPEMGFPERAPVAPDSNVEAKCDLCGKVVSKGTPANFFVYYEIDDDESKHELSLEEYGQHEVVNSWVLLEAEEAEEADAEAAEMEEAA